MVTEGYQIEEQGRIVRPNTRPGFLGIEINEEEIKKHPFEQELPQVVFYPMVVWGTGNPDRFITDVYPKSSNPSSRF